MSRFRKEISKDDLWSIAFLIFVMSVIVSITLIIITHLLNPWDDNIAISIAPFFGGAMLLFFVTMFELCPPIWTDIKNGLRDIYLEVDEK